MLLTPKLKMYTLVSKSKESNKSNRVKTKYCEDILAILGTRKKEFKISAPSEEQKQS
jgi:hypothetical protein